MEFFTEQQIRGFALAFLRTHYRLRERDEGTGTRVVSRPHFYNRTKIDARFSYVKKDKTLFVATVEATSADRAAEIVYRFNRFKAFARALTVALGIMAIILWTATLFRVNYATYELETGFVTASEYLAGTQVRRFNWVEWFGWPRLTGLLTSALVFFTAVNYWLLSRMRRFRYIYAIEQFKRFHADDQWIAYDARIFAAKRKKAIKRRMHFYEELRRQCVEYGFGLLSVEADGSVVCEFTPSRIDQFAGQRSSFTNWIQSFDTPGVLRRLPGLAPGKTETPALPAGPIAPTLAAAEDVDPKLVDPLSTPVAYLPRPAGPSAVLALPRAKPGRPKWYQQRRRWSKIARFRVRRAVRALAPAETRRQPGYYTLAPWVPIVGGLAFLGCAACLYQQSRYTPIVEVGNPEAVPEELAYEPARGPEDSDADPFVELGEYDPESESVLEEGFAPDHYLTPNDAPNDLVQSADQEAEVSDVAIYQRTADGQIQLVYDCLPLALLDTVFYVLREDVYPTFAAAQFRADELYRLTGRPVNAARNVCIDVAAPGYLVYFGEPLTDEPLINLHVRQLMRDYDLEIDVLRVE